MLPKIQTEAEFSELRSEHFVGFPPSRGSVIMHVVVKGPSALSFPADVH